MLERTQPRDHLRPEAAGLDDSGIVAILNHLGERRDVVPLWVGEGDLPAPAFIRDAAAASLGRGETFYTYQRGIPALREALARYHARVWNVPHDPERYFVTGSGMHAIQLAVRATCGTGDEAIMLSPLWPNIHEAVRMTGARPVIVELERRGTAYELDLDRLRAAVTARTRMIFVNTPANPTGWTADRATLKAILDLAREHGLWIVADEVYGRFVLDGQSVDGEPRAPSFYDVIAPDDRIVFANTFSKNWAMTGFRVGWLAVAPPLAAAIGNVWENLVQYTSSGSPVFNQHAAIAALSDEGEAFFRFQRERAERNRDRLVEMLEPHRKAGRVRYARPEAALYLFFTVEGCTDSVALALRMVDEARVAPAPGSAFYRGGEGHLRLCFLRDPAQIDEAAERLDDWLHRL